MSQRVADPVREVVFVDSTVSEVEGLLSASGWRGGLGAGGMVTVNVAPADYTERANRVITDEYGRILVVGHAGSGFTLLRLNTNGSLDTSFGSQHTGIVSSDLMASSSSELGRAGSVAVLEGGEILVAGAVNYSYGTGTSAMVRYDASGMIDSSFGNNGISLAPLTGYSGPVLMNTGVIPLSDGKILQSGRVTTGFTENLDFIGKSYLLRYHANGNLDTSFSGDGQVIADLYPGAGMVVQPDGKIVMAGAWNWDVCLMRLTPDGALDSTFGDNGKVTTDIHNYGGDTSIGIALQPDGKMVVTGYSYANSNARIFLARYHNNGTLDLNFGDAGRVITSRPGSLRAGGLAVQADGKILVAGDYDGDFALLRYNSDGSPDMTFDRDGMVFTDIGSHNDRAYSVTVQRDGKILVAGAKNGEFALVRYHANGSLDTSFDGQPIEERFGTEGHDTLSGGTLVDYLHGGLGDDTYLVTSQDDRVFEDADAGNDTVRTPIPWTLGANVENLVLEGSATHGTGNAGNNTLTGNSQRNELRGGAGDDTLYGLAGDDRLDGGAGGDALLGGTGDDLYIVGNSRDVITELADEGIDWVKSSRSWTLGDHLEHLTLTGSDLIDGTGNALDNRLIGNGVANTLIGGAGNDILDGGAGEDALRGDGGNDVYVVGNAGDRVVENSGEGEDLVKSSVNWTLGDHIEHLTFLGTGNREGTGNDLANRMTGNSGRNRLDGGEGNDRLIGDAGSDLLLGGSGADDLRGGAGVDTLTGGIGSDLFRYARSSEGGDIVTDFSAVEGDRLEFVSANFGNITLGKLAASRFASNGEGVATATTQRFLFNTGNGELKYDPDGSGARGAVTIATLQGVSSLSNNQIWLV
ncbi:MAG: hypothetical protein HQM00_07140 [Magnetococcales bacterium]|nr:hypothetical protein [Magnetococcales bacterium]